MPCVWRTHPRGICVTERKEQTYSEWGWSYVPLHLGSKLNTTTPPIAQSQRQQNATFLVFTSFILTLLLLLPLILLDPHLSTIQPFAITLHAHKDGLH
ncbi:hypothetical protein K440DRAFT_46894 [Wilcoxina mikolae CBS 423.85]|nr:hypothetical protein K440DRAFT_46894 [Wilcoxina mikolae CBS 423.85]